MLLLCAPAYRFYYLYNEVAFLALNEVAPVTHAVGNTIKRVVIILASVVVFRNPLSGLGALGSAIAIFGTLLYSLAKNKFQ
jgi:solute carrier family 35 protein E1